MGNYVKFPMKLVQEATRVAIVKGEDVYVYHDGCRFVTSAAQPDREIDHWRISHKGVIDRWKRPARITVRTRINYKKGNI